MREFVFLCTCATRMEAEIAKSFLEEQGVVCLIQGDGSAGILPYLNAAGGVVLRVRDIDLYRAKELMKEIEEENDEISG